jgi:hypothetical protein
MSAKASLQHLRHVALRVVVGLLLAAVWAPAVPAQQQPAPADAAGSAHAAPPGEGERSGDLGIPLSLSGHRSARPDIAAQPPKLKIGPIQHPAIAPNGPTIVDRNAIGLPVVRPAEGRGPAAINAGHTAVLPLPALSDGAAGLGSGRLPPPRVVAPAPRPLVVSRGAIDGAAFTPPGTALKPLGGPAKPAAIGINGTNFRLKH